MVTVFFTVLPSCTLPNAILGGFGTIALLDDPQPLNENIAEPFTLTLPFAVPVVLGLNETVTEALFPGARLKGNVGWLSLYTLGLAPMLEIVMVEEPLFVSTADNVSELPSSTSPKRRPEGFAASELEAAAGRPKLTLNKSAASKRETRDFETIWGRVMTLPVSPPELDQERSLRCIWVNDSDPHRHGFFATLPRAGT